MAINSLGVEKTMFIESKENPNLGLTKSQLTVNSAIRLFSSSSQGKAQERLNQAADGKVASSLRVCEPGFLRRRPQTILPL